MKWVHAWMALCLVSLGLGCRRDKTPTYYVDQEILDYCYFPNGSYWIYEEANTPGLIDSVYVIYSETIINPDYDNMGYMQESYGNRIVLRGKEYGRLTVAWPSRNEKYSDSETTELNSDSTGQKIDYVFFKNHLNSDTLASAQNIIITARYDTIKIRGNVYVKAIQVETIPAQAARHTFSTIWAKGVGVIERSMVDGTKWQLLRYHINQ